VPSTHPHSYSSRFPSSPGKYNTTVTTIFTSDLCSWRKHFVCITIFLKRFIKYFVITSTYSHFHSCFPGTRHITFPSKSQPLPPLESVEDTTWRKGFSPRKSSATYSGINVASRMIAPSMSSSRRASIRTSVKDQLGPEDVDSTIFLGRNMTLYGNDMATDSDVEVIPGDVSKRGE
jgi:hypothetical protein